MVKLYRWGQAGVEKLLFLSCSAVLIEYNIVIKAQPSVKISHLPLTSWATVSDLQPMKSKEEEGNISIKTCPNQENRNHSFQ